MHVVVGILPSHDRLVKEAENLKTKKRRSCCVSEDEVCIFHQLVYFDDGFVLIGEMFTCPERSWFSCLFRRK